MCWTNFFVKPEDEEITEETDPFYIKPEEDDEINEEIGFSGWVILHNIANNYPETPSNELKEEMNDFIFKFAKFFPEKKSSENFCNVIVKFKPKLESAEKFQLWVCQLHNRINKSLEKRIFDCRKYKKRWGLN